MPATDPREAPATVRRDCRDCGEPFSIPFDKAHARSKWYELCASCLRWQR